MSDSSLVEISESFEKIILRFSQKPSDEIAMTAGQVDALIEALGHMRTRLKPAQPATLPAEIGTDDVASNPRWVCRPLERRGVLLQIRSPAFGWLAFQLPPEEAAKLGRGLARYAAADGEPSERRTKTAPRPPRQRLN
jgi:hypothetical protein